MKTLKQVLTTKTNLSGLTKDGQRFVDKHKIEKTADVADNEDDVFTGGNIKAYDRGASNHGYDAKASEKVYESKTLKQILGQPVVVEKVDTPNEELFSMFSEEAQPLVMEVYNHLNEENKQKMIEMVEAEDYDTIYEIVKDVLHGTNS